MTMIGISAQCTEHVDTCGHVHTCGHVDKWEIGVVL